MDKIMIDVYFFNRKKNNAYFSYKNYYRTKTKKR